VRSRRVFRDKEDFERQKKKRIMENPVNRNGGEGKREAVSSLLLQPQKRKLI